MQGPPAIGLPERRVLRARFSWVFTPPKKKIRAPDRPALRLSAPPKQSNELTCSLIGHVLTVRQRESFVFWPPIQLFFKIHPCNSDHKNQFVAASAARSRLGSGWPILCFGMAFRSRPFAAARVAHKLAWKAASGRFSATAAIDVVELGASRDSGITRRKR